MIATLARAAGAAISAGVSAGVSWIARVTGAARRVENYIDTRVQTTLAAGDAEFEKACRDAVDLTRDGLHVPTTSDIDAMVADIEEHLRYSGREGGAT